MAYDYSGAIQAGANPSDVLNYMATSTGYDAPGAIKAGAHPQDVMKYMSGLSPKGAAPAQASPNPQPVDQPSETATPFSGTSYSTQPNSEPNGGAPQGNPTFLGSIIRGIAKPFVRLGSDVGGLLTGQTNQSLYDPYFGDVSGFGMRSGNTGGERAKDVAGGALDIGSYFVGGPEVIEGAKALQAGDVLARPALDTITAAAKTGAKVGAIQGAGDELQNKNSTVGSVAGNTIAGGATGGLFGGAFGAGAAALEKSGLGSKIFPETPSRASAIDTAATNKSEANYPKILELVRDEQVPGIGSDKAGDKVIKNGTAKAYAQGRGDTEGILNRGVVEESPEDIKRARAVQGIVDPSASKNQNIINLNQSIKETSENKFKPFLRENGAPYHWQELHDFANNQRPPQTITSNPAAHGEYQRIMNQAVDLATKYPQNSEGLNEARIAFDTIAKEELGNSVLGDPAAKGVKQGVQDARNMLNHFNENLMRYGPNMDKLNKAATAFNAFRERGFPMSGEGTEANPNHIWEALLKQSGVEPTPLGELQATKYRAYLNYLQRQIEARDNIAIKASRENGTTPLGRFFKKNPIAKIGLKAGFEGTGLGTAMKVGEHLTQ